MDRLIINGGRKLEGSVRISGAKNAVLPLIAAALLSNGKSIIKNVPHLRDVFTMCRLLNMLGAESELKDGTLLLDTSGINSVEAPYELVKTMRASVYVMGPLLARFGESKVSQPGGCAWGPRPIDLHLYGMEKLGAHIELEEGYIKASASKLTGGEIHFRKSSVGATGNVLMASVMAEGETVITNAAIEPEISSLAYNLVKMGANIEGIGSKELRITGVRKLNSLETSVIPDRIEAGTFLTAAALTGGKVTLENAEQNHLSSIIDKLKVAGASISADKDIIIESEGYIKPTDVVTEIYPGFPTDMQAQWIALMSIANGNSVVEDTIYLDRFTHVAELNRLGADIKVEFNKAYVSGVKELKGAPVMSTDLRASASLILAGLKAQGTTEVHRIYHIDRGYEAIEEKLSALGADIKRVSD
ncbi:UDP-N-acetylglucosamine 1-carboxyvinyltransferase [candidate division KSB1 bacterium]